MHMYNILSIFWASVFVMPCLLLEKAFYVQQLTECETMQFMFFISPRPVFFFNNYCHLKILFS
jgi:hypothetical protein